MKACSGGSRCRDRSVAHLEAESHVLWNDESEKWSSLANLTES